jgi:hypothetical protein
LAAPAQRGNLDRFTRSLPTAAARSGHRRQQRRGAAAAPGTARRRDADVGDMAGGDRLEGRAEEDGPRGCPEIVRGHAPLLCRPSQLQPDPPCLPRRRGARRAELVPVREERREVGAKRRRVAAAAGYEPLHEGCSGSWHHIRPDVVSQETSRQPQGR